MCAIIVAIECSFVAIAYTLIIVYSLVDKTLERQLPKLPLDHQTDRPSRLDTAVIVVIAQQIMNPVITCVRLGGFTAVLSRSSTVPLLLVSMPNYQGYRLVKVQIRDPSTSIVDIHLDE